MKTSPPKGPCAVRPCPICGEPATTRMRPFCSKRCADIDLGRWLGDVYRIPAVEDDDVTVSTSSREPDNDEI
ncbi:MAG: DNA gyrase inhibitor YacG [Rhodospirillales bacterium]|nr:DNA gyrase inhibitor YacG [Rhodospirillales bacterium]